MADFEEMPMRQHLYQPNEPDENAPKSPEKAHDTCPSSIDAPQDSGKKLKRLDIIIKPAVKRPPAITMSPIKPAPAEIRCKLAEERRKSLESGLVQKQKERDEKIVAAQKIKQEIDEKKQKAIKEQYERKIKASEELLAQQNQKLSEKIAAKAKKLEEAKKHHDETIAAKIKDAEQKLAKIVIYDEVREKRKLEIKEKQQHHFNKIQEAREKAEQQEKEEAEQKRKKTEEKEMLAKMKREAAILNLKENLHKQNSRASDVCTEKKRGKEMLG